MKEIIPKVKEIYHYICQYGLSKYNAKHNQKLKTPNDFKTIFKDVEKYGDFIGFVHEGFQKAQCSIIQELLNLAAEKEGYARELKQANVEKNENKKNDLKESIARIDYKECVYRKLADTIAWQLLNTQHYIVRRFYMGEHPTNIKSINLKDSLEFIEKFNKEKPGHFALLTDITSFIQIADVLIANLEKGAQYRIGLMELKSGKVNEEVREALDFFYKSKCEHFLYNFSQEKSDAQYEQLIRMYKQDYKMAKKVNILNKEEGIDVDGKHIKIIDKEVELSYFYSTIRDLIKSLGGKNHAITLLEGCLYIGVYSGDFPGKVAMQVWVEAMGINYPVFNFLQNFKVPCALPPFLMPLGEENLLNIVSGDLRIYFCLDFDKWFDLAKKEGLNVFWMSKKESARLSSSKEKEDLININERYIEYESHQGKLTMGSGMLTRIVFELVTPKSVLNILKMHIEEANTIKS